MEINYHCTLRMKMYLYYRIMPPDLISAYCKRISPSQKKSPYNKGERVWKLITSSDIFIHWKIGRKNPTQVLYNSSKNPEIYYHVENS